MGPVRPLRRPPQDLAVHASQLKFPKDPCWRVLTHRFCSRSASPPPPAHARGFRLGLYPLSRLAAYFLQNSWVCHVFLQRRPHESTFITFSETHPHPHSHFECLAWINTAAPRLLQALTPLQSMLDSDGLQINLIVFDCTPTVKNRSPCSLILILSIDLPIHPSSAYLSITYLSMMHHYHHLIFQGKMHT